MTKEEFHKKWENYWFYYKWHTIAVIFILIVVAISVTQCARRVDPDITVMFITKEAFLTDDQKTSLSDTIAKYTGDVNGDGRKVVDIHNMKINEEVDANMAMAYRQKLMAEVAGTDNTIFIADDTFYDYLNQNGDFFADLNTINSKVDKDTKKVKLSTISSFNFGTFEKTYGDLNIGARCFNSASPAKSTKPSIKNSVSTLSKLLDSYTK